MFMATFVRCLSYLFESYIGFKCLCCHSNHGRNERNPLGTGKLSKADNLCRVHKYAYQIFGHRKAMGSKDTFGIHIVPQERLWLMSSILQYR